MAKKNKRTGSGQRDFAEVLLQQARRELEKGNIRQALKDAKLLFRRDASDGHRQLLEEAYAARAEQLQQSGLPEQARAVYDELLTRGVRTPGVRERLPRLQLLLGVASSETGRAPVDLAQADPQFLSALADDAVLHPQRVAAAYADLKGQADGVRKALEAVERGDDVAAAEQLRDVAHRSPLADWKLFTRGLSAYYAGDSERMQANWDRLDPQRPARRIAGTLLVAGGHQAAGAASRNLADRLWRLEYARRRDPAAEHLKELSRHLQGHDWRRLLQSFRVFRSRYGASHSELVMRVTDLLWKTFARHGLRDELERLIGSAPAPPLDPHWHRARALCAAHPECAREEVGGRHWNAYLADLPQIAVLREEERRIAAGLVELWQARDLVRAAQHENCPPPQYWLRASPREAQRLRELALEHFAQSLRRCPQLLAAYTEQAALHLGMEHAELAAKTYKTLLKHFPDNYDALSWLASYYLEEDRPSDSEPYVTEAARLRPRDGHTVTLLWNQRMGMVRHCTRKRKFEQARRELAAAATSAPADVEPFWLDVARAAIEYKAQNAVAAEQHLNQAVARLQEPTPVWLAMHANAVRYNLDRVVKNDFSARFKAAVALPCTSQTAGQLSKYLAVYLRQKVTYTGFVTHQRALRKYLERAGDVAWEQRDLRAVCAYLRLDEAWRWQARLMLRKFAEVGARRFPQDPHFPFWQGEAEMLFGPIGSDLNKTIGSYERALELNAQTDSPLSLELVEVAKKSLTFVRDKKEFLSASMSFGDQDDDDYDDDDEDDDEAWDDDEWSGEDDDFEPDEDGPAMGPRAYAEAEALMRAAGLDPRELARKLAHGEMSPRDLMELLRRKVGIGFGAEE